MWAMGGTVPPANRIKEEEQGVGVTSAFGGLWEAEQAAKVSRLFSPLCREWSGTAGLVLHF